MSKTDWMKQNREELLIQSNLTKSYLTDNISKFGISNEDSNWINTEFVSKHDAFNSAFDVISDPSRRTPIALSEMKTAEKEFRSVYRKLYIGNLKNNRNVTSADLIAMGLPARSDDKRTPVPVPDSYPDLTAEPSSNHCVKITFRDSITKKVAKPRGVSGAVLRWANLPQQPHSIAELTNTLLDTKSPYTVVFGESNRAQTVYAAAAWQNTRGEMGVWSDIVSCVIP